MSGCAYSDGEDTNQARMCGTAQMPPVGAYCLKGDCAGIGLTSCASVCLAEVVMENRLQ
jgi:hypothetical protein